MARRKIKWKFGFLFSIILLNVFTKSLPIEKSASLLQTDVKFENSKFVLSSNLDSISDVLSENFHSDLIKQEPPPRNETTEEDPPILNSTTLTISDTRNVGHDLLRQLRPGQDARRYDVEITIDGGQFHGKVVIDVRIVDINTREDPIVFHLEDINVESVVVGGFSDENAQDVDFNVDDGILEIFPDRPGTSFIVIVEYSGDIRNDGTGIFESEFNGQSYIGMNLYPTHARRVFPCVDELNDFATVGFTFINVPNSNIVVNSMLELNSQTEFRPLQGPVHLWGMINHNFPTVVIPVTNVILFGRPGLGQDGQSAIAMQAFFRELEEWTMKPYFEILVNQDGRLCVVALPDTDMDWYALSSIGIWEPYVYMETIHSMQQRKLGLVKLAEAMARQWFGYVLYPDNWRSHWAIAGLATYAAYDVVKQFQTDASGDDITLLDMETLFVTDIIQESLLLDAYETAEVLIPRDDIVAEDDIRFHINGLLQYKAPAILNMLRNILGNDDTDYIQRAARALLSRRTLEAISYNDFYGALENVYASEGNPLVGDIEEYLEPWVYSRGYPLLHIGVRQGGLLLTQEHFSFTAKATENYIIPLTYTTSDDFDFSNVHPIDMKENTMTIPLALGDDDFVLFNIRGQGYYRVDYDLDLWERIIDALNDPERREEIHPLNRATLLDDALNLARAGNLDYDIALRVVLAMEHELDYAPWKAFVRNMNFLKKRLVALVTNDEDLDPAIYSRLLGKTIEAFEQEIGFSPDVNINEPAMVSLTRGLVMDHACRAKYEPCIAAAIDWFYDESSDEPRVNPNIPRDIRPAVYCTMVREGDAQVINALYARLDVEPSHYERVVILESLACSEDESFISTLLMETIADGSPYGTEERSKIFKAVAESSYNNARLAINFLRMRIVEVRNRYGGARKVEDLLFVLARNAVDGDLIFDLSVWINSINSNLDDSMVVAERALEQAEEDLLWNDIHLENVYEWFDENDAPKTVLSLILLSVTLLVTIFNH